MAQNDFSQGKMARNIFSMAAPMTVAQLVHILYNIVDRVYLGHIEGIGRLSITGVGLCLPIISIIMAFANLCGMGGAPLCSIYRGRGENEEAENVMGNSFTLILLFGISITLFGLAFKRPILYIAGASDATFPYANDYLTIYLLGTIFVMIGLGMNSFINAQGFGKMGMITVVIGCVLNLVLDPVFIFAFGMGVKGAAIATIISQAVSAAWVMRFLMSPQAILKINFSRMKLKLNLVRRILALGVSSFVMSMTNSLVQGLCNSTLQNVGGAMGDLYLGVMTVINSVREVITMPITGITHGCQPVLGYNFGAKLYSRVREGIRITTAAALVYSVASWAVVMAAPQLFIHIFNSEPEMIEYGVPAFRLYFCTFFFQVGQMVGQSVSVALGRSKTAVFFSMLRKVFIVAPLTVILPAMGWGVNGVFAAEPISNVVGGLACFAVMMLTVYIPMGKKKDKE